MRVEETSFASANRRDEVAAWIYTPETGPRAVLQLIHGYAEHSRRYLGIIQELTEAGVAVVADDHVGHGATATHSGHWVDTGGSKGYQTYIDDEMTLSRIAREHFPDLPLILFGHSWGSMIAREYVAQKSTHVQGMVLCGVVEQLTNAGLDLEVLTHSARAAIARRAPALSPDSEGAVKDLDTAIVSRAIARYDEDDPMAWIATDPAKRRAHADDPLSAVDKEPSVGFFKDLLTLYIRVAAERFVKRLPTDLPVLILSGDLDPMGNYGEGAYHLANHLWKEGNTQVRTRVFPGARHEVQWEDSSADEVMKELLAFVDRVVG